MWARMALQGPEGRYAAWWASQRVLCGLVGVAARGATAQRTAARVQPFTIASYQRSCSLSQ